MNDAEKIDSASDPAVGSNTPLLSEVVFASFGHFGAVIAAQSGIDFLEMEVAVGGL